MALPASGAISMSQVNTEIGFPSTSQISFNDLTVRQTAAQASGTGVLSGTLALSNLYGAKGTQVFPGLSPGVISTPPNNSFVGYTGSIGSWSPTPSISVTNTNGATTIGQFVIESPFGQHFLGFSINTVNPYAQSFDIYGSRTNANDPFPTAFVGTITFNSTGGTFSQWGSTFIGNNRDNIPYVGETGTIRFTRST